MKESITAIKWVLQGLMILGIAAGGWLGFKFMSEPGYLARLALGIEPAGEIDDATRWEQPGGEAPDGRVVTSRLPQASGVPSSRAPDSQRRLDTGSSSGATTNAGSYAPRSTATDGLRTVSRKKTDAAPAYAPPVAERKVIRVGD